MKTHGEFDETLINFDEIKFRELRSFGTKWVN